MSFQVATSQRWIESLRSGEPRFSPSNPTPWRIENPPDASSFPSGEKASAFTDSLWPLSWRTCRPVVASQIRITLPAPPTLFSKPTPATMLPSGEIAAARTSSSCLNTHKDRPVATSQSRKVWSWPPAATIRLPSREKASESYKHAAMNVQTPQQIARTWFEESHLGGRARRNRQRATIRRQRYRDQTVRHGNHISLPPGRRVPDSDRLVECRGDRRPAIRRQRRTREPKLVRWRRRSAPWSCSRPRSGSRCPGRRMLPFARRP